MNKRRTHHQYVISAPRKKRDLVCWPAILLVLASLGACTKRPPEITSESRENYQDLVFAVSQPKTGVSEGQRVLRATGLHEGKPVAFDVRVGGEWVERRVDQLGVVLYDGGTVELLSAGPESDALLNVVDRLYVTGLSPSKMNEQTKFRALAVAGNPNTLDSSPVKIKLFFVDPEDEERYAEAYLNFDLPRSRIQLLEKDEEYRRPFLSALTAPNVGTP